MIKVFQVICNNILMNYQKQRLDSGKKIKVSSIDRIGEPYRPSQIKKIPNNEVYYEKEDDVGDENDSLGSIKLYDLSNINNSTQPTNNRISIRSDVGAPIPLEYRNRRRNMSNVRYTELEENTKSKLTQPKIALNSKSMQTTNTAKKMDTFLKQDRADEKKRQLKITILATDDQDVVRVCKSLIREYSSNNASTIYTLSMIFLFILLFIISVTLLMYLIFTYKV